MHGGGRVASRHWKQIEKQRGTAMNNHRDENGVSWVCIVGVTGLLLGMLLLTRPLGDPPVGVEWYQKKRPVAVAAKPKPDQTGVGDRPPSGSKPKPKAGAPRKQKKKACILRRLLRNPRRVRCWRPLRSPPFRPSHSWHEAAHPSVVGRRGDGCHPRWAQTCCHTWSLEMAATAGRPHGAVGDPPAQIDGLQVVELGGRVAAAAGGAPGPQ